MIFRKATEEDVLVLTEISKKAFESDALIRAKASMKEGHQGSVTCGDTSCQVVGGKENEGPPGYDSYDWYKQMLSENHLFTYANENEIVGGAVLFKDESKLYVGRIFISPAFFKQGFGISLMEEIENYFSDVEKFNLDTPVWNARTNRFYHKCGYAEVSRDEESVYYEKIRKEKVFQQDLSKEQERPGGICGKKL